MPIWRSARCSSLIISGNSLLYRNNCTIEQNVRQTRTYFLKRLAANCRKRLTDVKSLSINLSHGCGKTVGIMWDKVGYICGYVCKGSGRRRGSAGRLQKHGCRTPQRPDSDRDDGCRNSGEDYAAYIESDICRNVVAWLVPYSCSQSSSMRILAVASAMQLSAPP